MKLYFYKYFMKRFIKSILVTVLSIYLTGCNVINENLLLGYFDEDNKSIAIVSGSDPLIVGIKQVFISNGWKVFTFNSTEDQDSISFDSITSSYIMLSEYNQGDDLLYGPFVQEYEFTIYDTNTEFEIVILYGSQRKVSDVIKEFRYVVENNYR